MAEVLAFAASGIVVRPSGDDDSAVGEERDAADLLVGRVAALPVRRQPVRGWLGRVRVGCMKTFAAFAFLLTVAAFGCTGTSPYMTPGDRAGITAAAESATVVFVRPSYGGADRVTLLDGKGRFLGDTLPRTHFAVTMPAGEHTFISWGENTSAIKATLAGGKVYYVEAYGPTGPGTPRLELRAVTLRSPSYGKIDEWLSKTQPLAPNETAGQAYLQGDSSGVASVIGRAARVLAEYKQELPEHTLSVEDAR